PSGGDGKTTLRLNIYGDPIGAREVAWLGRDIPVQHLIAGSKVTRNDVHGALGGPPVDIEGGGDLNAIIRGNLIERRIRNVGCLDRAVEEIRLPRNRHTFGQIARFGAIAILWITGEGEAVLPVESRQLTVAACPVRNINGERRRV